MHKETGEIRDYDKIPALERQNWSDPFRSGEIVEIKGMKMRLIKIKQNRQELHFKFEEVKPSVSDSISKAAVRQFEQGPPEATNPNCFVCGKPTNSHRIASQNMCHLCYTTEPEIVAELQAKLDAEAKAKEAAAAAKEPEEE